MADEVRFTCALSPEDLKFRELSANEELGRLFEFQVELLRPMEKKPLKAVALLGKGAGITLKVDNKLERHMHGVVTHFERMGSTEDDDIYRVVLRPWLWQLTLGADYRIFQDMTVIAILDKIFAEYGAASLVDNRTSGSFASRPYTVQYDESDFDFVTRLMEDEGIYYYFKHEAAQHTLVLCNSASGHDPMPGESLDWYARQTDNLEREDIVTEWSHQQSIQPLKYTHTDFAAEAPTTDLKASAERTPPYTKPNELEIFAYPGHYDDLVMGTNTGEKVTAGTKRAQREVNRYESQHSVATGLTPYRALAVGKTFTFKHYGDETDEAFLVTSTIVQLSYTGNETNSDERRCDYLCRFNAVPRAVAFLPERSVVRPVVRGPQTATVVGPKGDEIHTDKYGRIKLQFHWDRVGKRDEKSSCWVRVSYPSAGKAFGSLSLPRIGEEVVVDFLDGNPDRPLVTGRVYNGDNLPPYDLPKFANVSGVTSRSTKSGGTDGNELLFFDTKGQEMVSLRAQHDYSEIILHSFGSYVVEHRYEHVGKDYCVSVGENVNYTIGGFSYQAIGGDSSVEIGADLISSVANNSSSTIGGSAVTSIGGPLTLSVGAAANINIGAALNLTAGSALHMKSVGLVIDGTKDITLQVGPSFIKITADGITIQAPMVKINPGGAAGPANSADKANPPKPKKPAQPPEYKNPLGR